MAISVHSSAKNLGIGGKIVGTLFFSVFFLMGLFFEVMIVKQTARNLATYTWTQAEATILASEVHPPRHSDDDPTFHVRYTYVAGGSQRESRRFNRDAEAPETADAYQLAERFTIDKNVSCWINPQDSTDAVLHRKSPFIALIVLFPLIFVAVGGGGIWAMWFWKKKQTTDGALAAPISNKKDTTRRTRLGMIGFFSIFLLVGLGVGYGFFIRPVLQIAAARNWSAVPCEILSSRVKTHSDSDGSTYSVDVVYRYTYQNRNYTANRYHFFSGSSSGYKGRPLPCVNTPPARSAPATSIPPIRPLRFSTGNLPLPCGLVCFP